MMLTWTDIFPQIKPELVLVGTACILFLLGTIRTATGRKISAVIALLGVIGALVATLLAQPTAGDSYFLVTRFTSYVKVITAVIGVLLILLSWPNDADATGNAALRYGFHAGEYFGLMLLSFCGVFLAVSANDYIVLFLGIELASIPTYIMVSISRPIAAAQEAGVKYFFLGAMAAALMLFGFSYLFGSTGSIQLSALGDHLQRGMAADGRIHLSAYELLGVLFLLAGFSFKMAAFPLHFYVGDVYEGAATPVTALLSYVPKTSGFIALIKLLTTISGPGLLLPDGLVKLLWWLAVLTMTIGNCLGLLQHSVKRLLGYSSIAHTGYMLAALTLTFSTHRAQGIEGVLFYLAAYGLMNVVAFGVLILLPSRGNQPATSAETFEDLAGAGRLHPGLGIAMTIACLSLTGIPLTVGFIGKLYLIRPALHADASSGTYWLAAIVMANAAISAAYYLRIVDAIFLRTGPALAPATLAPRRNFATLTAVIAASAATVALGVILQLSNELHSAAATAASETIAGPAVQTAQATP